MFLTEGRQLVRHVLKVQRRLELSKNTETFESLVRDTGLSHIFADSSNNCGNTVRCYAGLFFAQKQMNMAFMHRLCTGGGICRQIFNHPNIIFPQHTFSSWLSLRNVNSLFNQLVLLEHSHALPKVYICSLSMVATTMLMDHEFIIVRHDQDAYQIIQGYMDTGQEVGYGLFKWQSSDNIFSGIFCKVKLFELLSHLQNFASDKCFDSENYFAFTQIHECTYANQSYSPSFSYAQLEDHHIIGWGSRPLSDRLNF